MANQFFLITLDKQQINTFRLSRILTWPTMADGNVIIKTIKVTNTAVTSSVHIKINWQAFGGMFI